MTAHRSRGLIRARIAFFDHLGDRVLSRYSDGGATDRDRAARRRRGKAQRAARRKNRGRA